MAVVDVFVYGTLRHAPLLDALIGGPVPAIPARLRDHRVVAWPEVHNPYLERHDGSVAEGLLLSGLSAAQRAALDLFEVPFGYHPQIVDVMTEAGPVAASAYFPDDTVPHGQEPWSLDRWAAQFGEVAVEMATEIAAHDPPLAAEDLVRQWGMIQSRAESKVRAGRTPAPATVRFAPKIGDFELRRRGPLAGGFFKLAGMTLQHRQFDGTTSEEMMRETLVGVDAALVLPYDAGRERVMLVEQVRAGMARRGDPNPWSLEPVAGIIDGGETPEDAARREGAEESGLRMDRLERMFSMYPSPGSSTDHFHCFLGHADLPSLDVGHGGLEDEHEDLRLHVMSLDEAILLTETGEANAGPLIAMLLWTARHRDRLRGG